MAQGNHFAGAVLLVLVPAAVARASPVDSLRGLGTILDRPPQNTGGLGADTSFRVGGAPFWERTADLFVLSAAQAAEPIRRITWWGFYNLNNPPATETMRVRLYLPRESDGLPGVVLHEQHFLDPLREATGRRVAVGIGPDEFRFQVDLATPLHLAPDTPYWLEIAQIGDIDTLFRWEFSTVPSPMGLALINPNTVDWKETTFNAHNGFQLSSVPEPATGFFFLFGLILMRSHRILRRTRT